ncbi:hypothetical protein EVAR_103139_1 [Eumeta japonica]|uniref:Uncharacterized protein n=1 Tax=Eumeta variegata TaxID=151549 RepID=A0A4C1YF00_EUMVA|nr:hypothetical protein EVAR_103139_1 [Eumeta japonica]
MEVIIVSLIKKKEVINEIAVARELVVHARPEATRAPVCDIGGAFRFQFTFGQRLIVRDSSPPINEVKVVRRVYHQEALNKDADYHTPKRTPAYYVRKLILLFGIKECIVNSLPIRRWLPNYKIGAYLLSDTIAGATMAVMHIPPRTVARAVTRKRLRA